MITGATRLTGVLGWPVSHSKSPRLHNQWLQQAGLDGVYLPLAVVPADLASVFAALPRLGFIGVNVTVPHKQAVIRLVDSLDPLAGRIGAVNTVRFDRTFGSHGSNTDAAGFLDNLRERQPSFQVAAAPAVLLGAGGAARAVAAALLAEGVPELRLLNRTADSAQALAADLTGLGPGRIVWLDWTMREEALDGAGLLVNSTSLGMAGQPPLALRLDALPLTALVNDLVYAPLETPLLLAAAARGNPVADGLGMLLHQARPAFHAWWQQWPQITDALRQSMQPP